MITQADAQAVMEGVFEECRKLRVAGQQEYARDAGNALRNFEAIAEELRLSREVILWVYTKKHLDGIVSYIQGHQSQRESVEGRINDVIVYLCLLRAMIEDKKHTDNRQKFPPPPPTDIFKMEAFGK